MVGNAQVRAAEREALAHCGDTPWTTAAVATTPSAGPAPRRATVMDMMCRAVEAEIVRILATAKPT